MRVRRVRPFIGIVVFTVTALGATACHPAPSGLVADYEFQDTRASSVGSPPVLTDINDNSFNLFVTDTVDGVERSVPHFPRGTASKLQQTSDVPISTTRYTVAILFRFAEVSGYERILQTWDDNSNTGLYVASGGVTFSPSVSGSTVIPADTYVQVVVTRQQRGHLRRLRERYTKFLILAHP